MNKGSSQALAANGALESHHVPMRIYRYDPDKDTRPYIQDFPKRSVCKHRKSAISRRLLTLQEFL